MNSRINAKNIELIITNLVRLLFVVYIGISIYNQNYFMLVLCIVNIILTYIPLMIEKGLKVYIVSEYKIIIIIFIFLADYLGEFLNFYDLFQWWDMMLHTASGVFIALFGYIGFYISNPLIIEKRIKINPLTMVLFMIGLALFASVLWEMFEYAMDFYFHLNMQKSGLTDTMNDLIVATIGAVFSGMLAYRNMKHNKKYWLMTIANETVEKSINLRNTVK